MDGIYIDGRRPKSKREVKEKVEIDPHSVSVEHTAINHQKDFTRVPYLVPGQEIHFVGPDPYSARNFYGTIRKLEGGKVIVK